MKRLYSLLLLLSSSFSVCTFDGKLPDTGPILPMPMFQDLPKLRKTPLICGVIAPMLVYKEEGVVDCLFRLKMNSIKIFKKAKKGLEGEERGRYYASKFFLMGVLGSGVGLLSITLPWIMAK